MTNSSEEILLIIDFGSQFTQLIARRLRELNVYCEIYPFYRINIKLINLLRPLGIILSGGPASVLDKGNPKIPSELYMANIPILGICYGQQLMMDQLGGTVTKGRGSAEFGRAFLSRTKSDCAILKGMFQDELEQVWMSHGDTVSSIPKSFNVYAITPKAPFAITGDPKKRLFAVQFHPEVYHTKNGVKLLFNFIQVCGFSQNWTMSSYKEKMIGSIRERVRNDNVICALSGGVDSSVAALLIHAAVGKQLTCIFVNHGMLRRGEAEQVLTMFRDHYDIKLIYADERDYFLKSLKGITDPEKKRKVIGSLFIDIFEKYSKTIGNVKYLAQGTLYPDVIESISKDGGTAVTIKSHHNVGGLPKKMNLKLIEPLRDLFKDEVRELGKELEIPKHFIERHPFPGPGLAIRCPGEISNEKLETLRHADAIFLSQIRKYGLYQEIWQAFVVLLPVKTVGVMGDDRTYDFVCALRAVTSVDGMTADYYRFSHDFLSETATKIINEVDGINRVTYDITSKPPGTIEWE